MFPVIFQSLCKEVVCDIILRLAMGRFWSNIKFAEFQGDNIDLLTNVITLYTGVHDIFGQLEVWFEEVPVRYMFRCVDSEWFFIIPFVQEKPTTYIFKKAKGYIMNLQYASGTVYQSGYCGSLP